MVRKSRYLLLGVFIFITGCNKAPDTPLITLTPQTGVESGDKVTATAISTDPEGDSVLFTWTSTGGEFDVTQGQAVVWTAPQVSQTQTFTITVEAQDSKGASSENSKDIQVDPGGGEPVGHQVILGAPDTSLEIPFIAGNYGRTQVLYYAGEIDHSGNIVKIATMATTTEAKTFNSFKIKLAETTLDSLVDSLSQNYSGGVPVVLYQEESLRYGEEADFDTWHDFELLSPFAYGGGDNLLVEFQFEGYQGVDRTVGCYWYDVVGTTSRSVTDDYGDGEASAQPGALYLRLTFEE